MSNVLSVRDRWSTRSGFTLIELLIVVAIIAILAAIAVPNFLNAQVRVKIAKVRGDQRAIATALTTYRLDNRAYPYFYLFNWDYDPYALQPPFAEYGTLEQNIGELAIITTPIPYMTSIPNDPFGDRRIGRPLPYDYHNFIAWRKLHWKMGNVDTNQIWSLRSRGPFRLFVSMTEYDPTNGTNSGGSLSRFGNWTTNH